MLLKLVHHDFATPLFRVITGLTLSWSYQSGVSNLFQSNHLRSVSFNFLQPNLGRANIPRKVFNFGCCRYSTSIFRLTTGFFSSIKVFIENLQLVVELLIEKAPLYFLELLSLLVKTSQKWFCNNFSQFLHSCFHVITSLFPSAKFLIQRCKLV